MPTAGSDSIPAARGPPRQLQGHRCGGQRVPPRRVSGFRKDAANAIIWIYVELTPSPSGSDSRCRWKGKRAGESTRPTVLDFPNLYPNVYLDDEMDESFYTVSCACDTAGKSGVIQIINCVAEEIHKLHQ
ncbi:hypothetical protein GUJ93_ZPchr0008g12950 [Zizania palustris]|uniref:Uncharacterized protein n=1 Tax=Zizania palustris TaxID=103762 RepID=A0A8J5RVR0_ZIZPA|nr:hypothetical protein GUJ93_ZPchr0008g12950 [Zizania palustris]